MAFYILSVHDLDIIKINECLVAKNLLTNVTKPKNVATFVHALLGPLKLASVC